MERSKSKTQKSAKLTIRQRRVFSDEFKREKVAQILSKELDMLSFCKLWKVSRMSVYRWIYQYSPDHKKGTTIVVQKDSESAKLEQLGKKVAELERALGQKQMVIDFQDKLIQIASKELDIDIKKNFSPGA